jgi:hypothetical protein
MFAKTSITSSRTEKITDLIVRMITKDSLPIIFVEGDGFRELMAYIEPGYNVPCAKTVKTRLNSLHAAAKVKVREMLHEAPSVSLTTDCWTSSATESYMTLTAHYINAQSFSMASWHCKPEGCIFTPLRVVRIAHPRVLLCTPRKR